MSTPTRVTTGLFVFTFGGRQAHIKNEDAPSRTLCGQRTKGMGKRSHVDGFYLCPDCQTLATGDAA